MRAEEFDIRRIWAEVAALNRSKRRKTISHYEYAVIPVLAGDGGYDVRFALHVYPARDVFPDALPTCADVAGELDDLPMGITGPSLSGERPAGKVLEFAPGGGAGAEAGEGDGERDGEGAGKPSPAGPVIPEEELERLRRRHEEQRRARYEMYKHSRKAAKHCLNLPEERREPFLAALEAKDPLFARQVVKDKDFILWERLARERRDYDTPQDMTAYRQPRDPAFAKWKGMIGRWLEFVNWKDQMYENRLRRERAAREAGCPPPEPPPEPLPPDTEGYLRDFEMTLAPDTGGNMLPVPVPRKGADPFAPGRAPDPARGTPEPEPYDHFAGRPADPVPARAPEPARPFPRDTGKPPRKRRGRPPKASGPVKGAGEPGGLPVKIGADGSVSVDTRDMFPPDAHEDGGPEGPEGETE
ncbi:MAG: hypothetical protein LBG06_11975 [Deltaproteobacteria bacterium]|jgi:hypothetical protein|nr:hypothetical protein [Deltaproteobacteria bacterium]